MLAQLKTYLAVHDGGRMIMEEWLIGKRMFNFKFTVMRETDLQRITLSLGYKIFKTFENFKMTFGYYLFSFCVLILFQVIVLLGIEV